MRTKNRKAKIANYYNLQEKQDKLYAKSKDEIVKKIQIKMFNYQPKEIQKA